MRARRRGSAERAGPDATGFPPSARRRWRACRTSRPCAMPARDQEPCAGASRFLSRDLRAECHRARRHGALVPQRRRSARGGARASAARRCQDRHQGQVHGNEEIALNVSSKPTASCRSRPISANTSCSCATSRRAISSRRRSTCEGTGGGDVFAPRIPISPPSAPLVEPRLMCDEARAVLRQQFLAADVGITGANFLSPKPARRSSSPMKAMAI